MTSRDESKANIVNKEGETGKQSWPGASGDFVFKQREEFGEIVQVGKSKTYAS